MPNIPDTAPNRNGASSHSPPDGAPQDGHTDGPTLPSALPAFLRALRDEIRELRRQIDALRDQRHPDTLLTRQQAADRLSISKRTLDDLAADGQIQPTRIRGCVRYHPETVSAFIRSRTEREGRR